MERFEKHFIIDIWQTSEYAIDLYISVFGIYRNLLHGNYYEKVLIINVVFCP